MSNENHTDPSNLSDLSDLDLVDRLNALRRTLGGVSFDKIAEASGGQVKNQTVQRMADRSRPYDQPVFPASLIGVAEGLNHLAGSQITTPWALWEAHGISFERTHGLWGRPTSNAAAALPLLVADWHTLHPARLAAWNRAGQALLAEQRAETETEELTRLRTENTELKERLARKRTRT